MGFRTEETRLFTGILLIYTGTYWTRYINKIRISRITVYIYIITNINEIDFMDPLLFTLLVSDIKIMCGSQA